MKERYKIDKNMFQARYNVLIGQKGYGRIYYEKRRLILQNEYYKKEIEKYKKLAGRIENQIELLEKEKRDFLFIDNTECEYFKRVSDTLECLKRIYFNY